MAVSRELGTSDTVLAAQIDALNRQAIVKLLVDLHGGSVWAESDSSQNGTTFIVELPAALHE